MQLALVGTFAADDDPEAPVIYRAIRDYAGTDPDVHLFTDPARVGAREVNAFQSASDVILQRSTREGFGLTVTEAMWKARPVVATPVGGITVQIQHEHNGYMVESSEECAECIVRLLTDDHLAQEHRCSCPTLRPRTLPGAAFGSRRPPALPGARAHPHHSD